MADVSTRVSSDLDDDFLKEIEEVLQETSMEGKEELVSKEPQAPNKSCLR